MLPLVPSQKAALDRLRASLRWAGDFVALIGTPGQGKSRVLEALVLEAPFTPLALDGEAVQSRQEAITDLAISVGLKPEADEAHLLAGLHQQGSSGQTSGTPDIWVDNAHRLPSSVLMWLFEMTQGRYGRRWSVLLVGEPSLVDRMIELSLLPSQVILPRWDLDDLMAAWPAMTAVRPSEAVITEALAQWGTRPAALLEALSDAPESFGSAAEPEESSARPESHQSRRFRLWIFILLGATVLIGLGYGQYLATQKPVPKTPVIIPLSSGPNT